MSGRQDNTRGIVCPECGCKRSRVVYTRVADGGILRRRRECLGCKRRILTEERICG